MWTKKNILNDLRFFLIIRKSVKLYLTTVYMYFSEVETLKLFLKNVNPKWGRMFDFAINTLKILILFCHCCLVSIRLRSGHSHGKFQIFTFCPHSTVGRILQGPYRSKVMLCWVIFWAWSVNSIVRMNYLHLSAASSGLACQCTSIPTCNTLNITVFGLFWTEQNHCAKIHDDSSVSTKLHIGQKRQQFNRPVVIKQMTKIYRYTT